MTSPTGCSPPIPYSSPPFTHVPTISEWHSGLSPFPYELVMRAHYQCTICYGGCKRPYTVGDAFVVRHQDKRVMGKDQAGNFLFNETFKPTYYHVQFDCIKRRNFYFDGTVHLAKTLADHNPVETFNYITNQCRLNRNEVESSKDYAQMFSRLPKPESW